MDAAPATVHPPNLGEMTRLPPAFDITRQTIGQASPWVPPGDHQLWGKVLAANDSRVVPHIVNVTGWENALLWGSTVPMKGPKGMELDFYNNPTDRLTYLRMAPALPSKFELTFDISAEYNWRTMNCCSESLDLHPINSTDGLVQCPLWRAKPPGASFFRSGRVEGEGDCKCLVASLLEPPRSVWQLCVTFAGRLALADMRAPRRRRLAAFNSFFDGRFHHVSISHSPSAVSLTVNGWHAGTLAFPAAEAALVQPAASEDVRSPARSPQFLHLGGTIRKKTRCRSCEGKWEYVLGTFSGRIRALALSTDVDRPPPLRRVTPSPIDPDGRWSNGSSSGAVALDGPSRLYAAMRAIAPRPPPAPPLPAPALVTPSPAPPPPHGADAAAEWARGSRRHAKRNRIIEAHHRTDGVLDRVSSAFAQRVREPSTCVPEGTVATTFVNAYHMPMLHLQAAALPRCFTRRYVALCSDTFITNPSTATTEAPTSPSDVSPPPFCVRWGSVGGADFAEKKSDGFLWVTWLRWELLHLALLADGVEAALWLDVDVVVLRNPFDYMRSLISSRAHAEQQTEQQTEQHAEQQTGQQTEQQTGQQTGLAPHRRAGPLHGETRTGGQEAPSSTLSRGELGGGELSHGGLGGGELGGGDGASPPGCALIFQQEFRIDVAALPNVSQTTARHTPHNWEDRDGASRLLCDRCGLSLPSGP